MTNEHPSIREAKRRDFLAALADLGVVGEAAALAGVDRSTVWRWRETDPAFAALFDEAIEAATDRLESVARRRATEGYERPVYYKGEEIGRVTEYSDTLLALLLKANRAKFRDTSKVELSGRLAIGEMTDHEIRRELAELAAAGVVAAPPDLDDAADLL